MLPRLPLLITFRRKRAQVNLSLPRKLLALSAFFLFLLSLTLPALTSPEATVPGWFVLLMGWFGYAIGEWRWYANIFFLCAFGLILSGEHWVERWAILAALVSTVIASSCFWLPPKIATGGSSSPRVAQANLETGAYCWIAAHTILLLASLISLNKRQRIPTSAA
jgi:hypothetical protein